MPGYGFSRRVCGMQGFKQAALRKKYLSRAGTDEYGICACIHKEMKNDRFHNSRIYPSLVLL